MRYGLVLPLLALTACGTILPPTPQTYRQALVEAAVTYQATAALATAYAQQEWCGAANAKPPPLCADRQTVVVLDRASKGALAALHTAEALDGINNPGAQDKALAVVEAALSDFSSLTNAAKGK